MRREVPAGVLLAEARARENRARAADALDAEGLRLAVGRRARRGLSLIYAARNLRAAQPQADLSPEALLRLGPPPGWERGRGEWEGAVLSLDPGRREEVLRSAWALDEPGPAVCTRCWAESAEEDDPWVPHREGCLAGYGAADALEAALSALAREAEDAALDEASRLRASGSGDRRPPEG